MNEKIEELCRQLEKEKKIRILFAVENGSRAWRMSSNDSDYDVRFVYARPVEDYVTINKQADVIEAYFNEKCERIDSASGALIDFVGFDVFKFAKMLSSSNPTTIEWLVSDIVYYGKQNKVFREFAVKNFNHISLYHHYKSMCRQNYLKYLKSGNEATYKKYLYAYRGLVNAKWVVHKKTVPPIIFTEALEGMKKVLPSPVYKKINEIITLKSAGREKEIVQNIVTLDSYLEDFLKDDSDAPKEKSHVTIHELDKELKNIILKKKN